MANYIAETRKAALRYGIDPVLFSRQIKQESGFRPDARSSAGAIGIAQIVPKYHPGVDPTDPIASLDYAAKWMSQLVHQYGGSYAKALSVYNSGKPDAYLDPNFAGGQTYNYVRSIMGNSHPQVRQPAQPSPGAGTPTAATGLGGGLATSTLATQAQDGAAALRSQARQNLQDIASGTVKPTDSLQKLGDLARSQQAQPAVPTPAGPVTFAGDTSAPGAAKAVALAKKYLGVKYTWGGEAPDTGFDCSGLLQYVWKTMGVSIPRTTYDQWDAGHKVSLSALKPGDAVFFTGSDPMNGKPGHVGMYLGQGRFIEAPGTGKTVRISTLAGRKDYMGARRFG